MSKRTIISPLRVAFLCLLTAVMTPEISALHAEYFWNQDPGISNATSVTLSDADGEGFCSASLSAEGMTDGLNRLGMRVRYCGHWSATHNFYVWKTPENSGAVLAAEYFFDGDPGVGKATALSGLAGTGADFREVSIPVQDIAPGRHLFGLRVKGAGGWSATQTTVVNITDESALVITGLEYFWDEDPGAGMATPVELSGARTVDVIDVTVGFPEYEADEYTLSFRAKAGERWGAPYSVSFVNVPLTGLSVDPSVVEVMVSKQVELSVSPEPVDALFTDCVWTSDNPDIAAISADGVVTGLAVGTTTVHAVSIRYPEISSACDVVVTKLSSGISDAEYSSVDIGVLREGIVVRCGRVTVVTIVDISGKTVFSQRISGTRHIPLPAGVYIATVPNSVKKLVVE